jgi:hypothetical protein
MKYEGTDNYTMRMEFTISWDDSLQLGRRNALLPFPGSKSNPNKEPARSRWHNEEFGSHL